MTKSMHEIRMWYPHVSDYANLEIYEEHQKRWKEELTLRENCMAFNDMALDEWFKTLPIEVKEGIQVTYYNPALHDKFFMECIPFDEETLEEMVARVKDEATETPDDNKLPFETKVTSLEGFRDDRKK